MTVSDMMLRSGGNGSASAVLDALAGGEKGQLTIRKIPLDLIDPWEDPEHKTQPFKPYSPEKLQELADNMDANGQLSPVRLRPSPTAAGRFQALAGHNRCRAAKLKGWTMIDAIVEAVDDDQARLILVDSNLQQREKLLPSEKAWAYKLRMDALRHQGKATDSTSGHAVRKLETSRQRVGKLESADMVSQDESGRNVQRYIRLTLLHQALLDMVDSDAIPLMAGVALSFLSSAAQDTLLRVMRAEGIKAVNRSQAEALKDLRDRLDGEDAEALILRVFGRGAAAKPPKLPTWKFASAFPSEVVKRYQRDAELQERVRETIRQYIEERERSEKS